MNDIESPANRLLVAVIEASKLNDLEAVILRHKGEVLSITPLQREVLKRDDNAVSPVKTSQERLRVTMAVSDSHVDATLAAVERLNGFMSRGESIYAYEAPCDGDPDSTRDRRFLKVTERDQLRAASVASRASPSARNHRWC